MPVRQQEGGTRRKQRYRLGQRGWGGPPDPGQNFGTGIVPRCMIASGTANGTTSATVSLPLTGWANSGAGEIGNAPQAGDLVIIFGSLFSTVKVASQTAGTGTWTFQSTDTDNANAPAGEAWCAWRIFNGTETAPTFTFTPSGGRHAWVAVAITPDPVKTVAIDVWATALVDAAATSHTPNSAVAAGSGELSLLLGAFYESATGDIPPQATWPAGWAVLQSQPVWGTAAQHVQLASAAWATGLSGTVTPGAVTLTQSSTSLIFHVLVTQSTPVGGAALGGGGGTITAVGLSPAAGAATLTGGQGTLTPAQRFTPIRADGGGTVQVMAKNGSTIICGADTQGYYRTTDKGDHWRVVNRGIGGIGVSDYYRQSASIAWSVTETNTVYSCVGDVIAVGATPSQCGLLVSNDGGDTWFRRSGVPQFAGNHGAPPLPGANPRSTGHLIAQDGGFLFVGTYNQGVMRSANNGTDDFPVTCTMGGSAPGTNFYARSLIRDPNNAGTLFVSMYDWDGSGNFGKVWKCTADGATTPNFTQLTAAPSIVEEMCIVGTALYAACGPQGIYRSTDGGTTWSNLSGTFVGVSGNDWNSIDGYVDGSGNHVVIAADSNPSDVTKCLVSLTIPSTFPGSGSITYAALTGSVQVATMPPDSRTWWLPNWPAGAPQALGGASWQNGFVLVDASNLASVDLYVSGSGGFYRNLGGTGWTVACNGIPAYPARNVACDPNDANHFIYTTTDWGIVDISDGIGFDSSGIHPNTANPSHQGYGIGFDPTDSTVYAAMGDKGVAPSWGTNSTGGVFYRPRASLTPWTDTGLATAMGTGNVPLGLQGLRDGSAVKTLLAAVWNGGVWRGQFTSSWTWTHVATTFCNTPGAPGTGNLLNIDWPGSGQYVYVYDPDKGIYRSNDYGVTWVQVYAVTSTDKNAVAVAANPLTPGEVWFTAGTSSSSGVYKITGAHTGTVGSGATVTGPYTLPGSVSAGCVAISAIGIVYVTAEDRPGSTGTGLVGTADGGTTWYDVVGDGSLAFGNSRPSRMDVAVDGRVYLSGSNIVAQGFPLTVPVPATAALSGSGTLTASRTLIFNATAALSGAGTLAASPVFTAIAALSGTGTLTAASKLAATAALSGTGTLSAAPQFTGSAALSGSGTLTASPTVIFNGAAALSGTGTLAASPVLIFNPAAALSGSGTLNAAPVFAGSAALSGSGVFTAAGVSNAGASATLAGSGTLTATPVFTVAAALSGSGTLAAAPLFTGSASLSGSGTLSAAPVFVTSAALSGQGTLTAAPAFTGAAALSGSGTLAGAPLFTGSGSLSGSGTLSAAPVLVATAALSGTGTLSAALTIKTSAALSGTGTLTAAPVFAQPAALSGSGTLTSSWTFGELATLSGTGTLTAAYGGAGSATLSGSGTLTAAWTLSIAAGLSGTGTLAAAPQLQSAATLSGAGTLAAAPRFTATAALSGTGTLTAAPLLTATAALSGSGTLAAAPQFPGTAAMSGAGTLTASPLFNASAALSGSGTLSALPLRPATATLAGTGTLTSQGAFAATAALSGTGTLNAGPLLTAAGVAALSGSGTLTSLAGTPGSAAFSGSGTLSAAVTVGATAALSGTGTLIAGYTVTLQVAAALSGSGVLTANVTLTLRAAATLSGSGVLAAGATQTINVFAVLSGSGVLAAVTVQRPPNIPGTSVLAVSKVSALPDQDSAKALSAATTTVTGRATVNPSVRNS